LALTTEPAFSSKVYSRPTLQLPFCIRLCSRACGCGASPPLPSTHSPTLLPLSDAAAATPYFDEQTL
jgi:hypothetical protein